MQQICFHFKQQQLRRVLMYHSVVKSPGLAHQKSDIYSISETHFIKHVDLLATQNVLGNRKVVALEDSYPSGFQSLLTTAIKTL